MSKSIKQLAEEMAAVNEAKNAHNATRGRMYGGKHV